MRLPIPPASTPQRALRDHGADRLQAASVHTAGPAHPVAAPDGARR